MANELVLLRRKHALTQGELAKLIGSSQTTLARLEAGDPERTLQLRLSAAFGLQVVLGKRPDALFPDLYIDIEDAVMRQALELDRTLDGRSDRPTEYKRALLRDMVRRASNRPILP